MTNPYLKSQVMTASPGQLLLMLYDGALRFNNQAIHCYGQQRDREASHAIERTLKIVWELHGMLNPAHAPDLCARLEQLYVFVEEQLLKALAERNPAPLQDAGQILDDLRGAWREAVNGGADKADMRRVG